jgi:hypothetical protein
VISGLAFYLPANWITAQEASKDPETVRGSGCDKFGDEEIPAKAMRAATANAQKQTEMGTPVADLIRQLSLFRSPQLSRRVAFYIQCPFY